MKKILILPLVVTIISIMFFSIHTVTAAGPLNITAVDNFVILANTYTNSINPTILNGDLGYLVAPATPPTVNGVTVVGAAYTTANTALSTLYDSANNPLQSGACDPTKTFVVDTVLDTIPQPLVPGVYCIDGDASVGSAITLGGDGVYIFRITGALNVVEFASVTLAGNIGADDVFWVPVGATTLNADSIFAGIILTRAATTLLASVVMEGRILSNSAVTTTGPNDVITAPLVTIAPPIIIAEIQDDDCNDCVPPTLGLSSNSVRKVDQGFSYNGKTSNVELFLTPLQLTTTKVGDVNKAVFKIFEAGGPDEVRHFELIFGLAKGQILGDSKAMIELDRSWDGINTVKVIDPDNALKDVKVETSEGACKTASVFTNDCLIVTVYYTFTAPLEFDIIATSVWDEHRNAWQNYFTPGIKVIPESVSVPIEDPGFAVILTNKVLISDLNVTKSKVAVGDTVHVSFRVTGETGNFLPWVTPDVGICKVSAVKPHYVLVTPKSPLANDSDCPFFQSDFLSSSDRYGINLVIPEGLKAGKYKLDVWADPDYIGQSGVVGDHESVDITVINSNLDPTGIAEGEYGIQLSEEGIIKSPLKQFEAGIAIDKIQCKENLQLVIRTSNDNPACVKPVTKQKLIERGWAKSQV